MNSTYEQVTLTDLPRRPPVISVWVSALVGPLMLVGAVPTFGHHQGSGQAEVGQVLLGGGVLVTLLAPIISGILVIVWLARARRIAVGRGGYRPHLSAGLATASWFVPVVNLWLPAVAVLDVARAADPGCAARGGRSALDGRIWGWWAMWLGSWIAFILAVTSVPVRDSLGGLALFLVLFAALMITAAALFTSILRRVARWLGRR